MALFVCLAGFTGCDSLRHLRPATVYVSVQRVYLRDRVAAVSNRTAEVTNGEPLTVLEHDTRFYRVRTPKNETGWIEEHMVIDQATYAAFRQLAAAHKDDPVVADALLKAELYMHVAPGRDKPHFYLLPSGATVQLLERASVAKTMPGAAAASLASLAQPKDSAGSNRGPASSSAPPAPPVEREDWWLARDAQGRTGWMLASRLYVEVPDDIEQYGEGQRFIGAWKIATVNDPESKFPDHQAPEYLTVLAPLRYGLPFDFDQVRLFTWSRVHHRYETGFRLHPIQGFLPVKLFTVQTPQGPVPAFSFQIASTPDLITDPDTGIVRPKSPRTIQFELVDTTVRRIGPDQGPISTLPSDQPDQKSAEKKVEKGKRRSLGSRVAASRRRHR